MSGNWAYNGAAGWSYDEVLPFFKRSEDFEDGASFYHGSGGPLPVTRNHSPNPVSLAFLDACAAYGLPLNDDCNGERILGAGLAHFTIKDGRRASAWTSFVLPVIDSPLLTVITGAQVTGLLRDASSRAVGVRLSISRTGGGSYPAAAPDSAGGPATELRCSGDVIVSCGVIGSAQLLLLSGIGPAGDLRALGIDVTADLPGVGANLRSACPARLRALWPGAFPRHSLTRSSLIAPQSRHRRALWLAGSPLVSRLRTALSHFRSRSAVSVSRFQTAASRFPVPACSLPVAPPPEEPP